MTPKNQESQRLYLILSIVLICLLVGGVGLWFQRMSRNSSAASEPAPAINVPSGQYPTLTPSAPAFTVQIRSLGGSGITGTATFQDIAGSVAILLHVDGLPEEEEDESVVPVELHSGSCAAPGALAYEMTAPDAGESETDLDINLQQFNTERPFAIVLYRSLEDHTAIACGDVP